MNKRQTCVTEHSNLGRGPTLGWQDVNEGITNERYDCSRKMIVLDLLAVQKFNTRAHHCTSPNPGSALNGARTVQESGILPSPTSDYALAFPRASPTIRILARLLQPCHNTPFLIHHFYPPAISLNDRYKAWKRNHKFRGSDKNISHLVLT